MIRKKKKRKSSDRINYTEYMMPVVEEISLREVDLTKEEKLNILDSAMRSLSLGKNRMVLLIPERNITIRHLYKNVPVGMFFGGSDDDDLFYEFSTVEVIKYYAKLSK